jgi:hypothetical protein
MDLSSVLARERWTVEGLLQQGRKQVILYFRSPPGLLELTLYYALLHRIDKDFRRLIVF